MGKLLEWMVLGWTIFILFVYIGGYFLPDSIGVYTWNLSAVYAVILIIVACIRARRLVSDLSIEGRGDKHSATNKRK
jgi:hypothetical protein